jgi:dihydroflavonol-4-reductase
MKPALITGATGFLGRHLVGLLKDEQPLRVFSRGATPWDGDPAVETVRGDITSAADVARAMLGAGCVYHLAGVVSRDPKDDWLLYRVHVDGTRLVCEAARAAEVEKVVVVSSSGTVAVSAEPVVHDENSGYKHAVVGRWAYYLSKIYAEKLALAYGAESGLPVVAVNPALLLGPGDEHGSSTGDVEMFLDGEILALPGGGMSFVDARDAAAGLAGAMRRGRSGERYLLGGVNWTFRRIIEKVSEISGVRPPRMEPSLGMSLASARVLRRVFPLIGRRFRGLDDDTIRMAALYWYCDSSKAAAELGFTARDAAGTLRDTVEDIRKRRRSS